MTARIVAAAAAAGFLFVGACRQAPQAGAPRANGYVEATDVRLSSKVPGRVKEVAVVEGQRVAAGDRIAAIDTTDIDLAESQARAERGEADAQWRLLLAGARPEDIVQAQAEVDAALSDRQGAAADLESARTDEARFTALLGEKAGTEKQRDDAVARRQVADARLATADHRARAAAATLDKLKAGSRPQELDAAKARVASVDARIAALDQQRADAVIVAPSAAVVTSRLVEPGELVAVGTPVVALVDLDHAWASVYVEEPIVPSLKIDEAATVITDRGDRRPGRISFISPEAEFTPRNVQTADERAKLVYRVKVAVDNRDGVLKPGMPVEADFGQGSR